MTAALDAIAELRMTFAGLPPPVVVFCKSHSGSRLLARLMMAGGIWLGDDRNDSEDSADILRLIEPLVERHHPDFSRLFREGDPEIFAIARDVILRHVARLPAGMPWGWKLCETGYALPLLQRIFPDGHFIHLLRDGRDVAFSNHVAPHDAFWRKIYFDTDGVTNWRGRKLRGRDYRRASHLFNAQHWVNSVRVARAYGAMIGPAYQEIRYETLVEDPVGTTRALFDSLGLAMEEGPVLAIAADVHKDRVGKYRRVSLRRRLAILSVLSPTLQSFGYGLDEPDTLARRLMQRLRFV